MSQRFTLPDRYTMKDFVIYTVLTGGYDDVLQPRVVD